MMSSIMAMLGLDVSPFKRGLMSAQSDASHAGKSMGDAFSDAIGEKLGRIASFAALEEMSRKVIEFAEKIDIVSDRLGISTEEVQRWDYALRLNGSSIDQASKFFMQLAVNRQKALEGSKPQQKAFEELGVSLKNLQDMRLSPIAIKIAETFEGGDQEKLFASLKAVGGRGAIDLSAALKAGLTHEMAKAPIIPDEQIGRLKSLADDLKDWGVRILGFFAKPVEVLGETIRIVLEATGSFVVAAGQSVAKFFESIYHSTEKFGAMDMLNPVKIFKTLATAGKDAAKEFGGSFDDAMNGFIQREAEWQEKRKARKEALEKTAGVGDEFGSGKKDKREEIEKEILKLKQEAERITESTALKSMTAAQKIEEIERRIARVRIEQADAVGAGNELAFAHSDVEIAKLKQELVEAKKAEAAEEKKEMRQNALRSPEVNALQRIGAYVDPAVSGMSDHMAKSAQHLAVIQSTLQEHTHLLQKTQY